jgi:hypothetical protein
VRRPRIGPCARRLAWLAIATISGCTATGVTLRSNHYRVYVPPDWPVIATGGVTDLPTVLRVPAPPDRAAAAMEIRLYPWLAQGPLADPTGDALKHLVDGGVLDLATATADDETPCREGAGEFFIFGKSTRAIHVKTATGQRVVITAGHANGSLVSVVGIVAPGQSACAGSGDMDSAIRRLAAAMTSSGDPTRAPVPPTILASPSGGRQIEIAPADPGALTP